MAQPADWAQRFQQMTADAGQSYARGMRRYQELLQRVASGELKPDDVQRIYREYFQDRASSSTRELVELSVGLLAGLLHTEASYRDSMLDGLLPPAGATPQPPLPSGVDLTNWFQALATYTSEQGARALRRQQQLVERISSGQVTSAQVQQQGQQFLQAHSAQFLGDVIALGMHFVAQLHRNSSALSDGLYDRVLGPELHFNGNAPGPVSAPEPPLCVDLRGTAGTMAAACIVIENTRAAPAQVECRASHFVPRTGGAPLGAVLEITPARFTLPAGGQAEVDLRLLLDREQFETNADYAASLVVTGAGERELVVQVTAQAH